jgi:hypothetical protein
MGSPFSNKVDYDVEANQGIDEKHASPTDSFDIGDEGAIHTETLVIGDSLYARVQRFASKFGVEARGIERVPSNERTDTNISKIGTMVCAPSSPRTQPQNNKN